MLLAVVEDDAVVVDAVVGDDDVLWDDATVGGARYALEDVGCIYSIKNKYLKKKSDYDRCNR